MATKLLCPRECSKLGLGFPWIPKPAAVIGRSGSLWDFRAHTTRSFSAISPRLVYGGRVIRVQRKWCLPALLILIRQPTVSSDIGRSRMDQHAFTLAWHKHL